MRTDSPRQANLSRRLRVLALASLGLVGLSVPFHGCTFDTRGPSSSDEVDPRLSPAIADATLSTAKSAACVSGPRRLTVDAVEAGRTALAAALEPLRLLFTPPWTGEIARDKPNDQADEDIDRFPLQPVRVSAELLLRAPRLELDERGLPAGAWFCEDWEITPRQTKRALDLGEVVLIDCRTPREYGTAHIDGALHVPMTEVTDRLEELDEHRERAIVVYCRSGMRSLSVTALLRARGFADVRSMAGGILLWSHDIDDTVPRL